MIPVEVTYSDLRPTVAFGMDNAEENFEKGVLTKSRLWGYEKEQRVIDHLRGPGVHRYAIESRLYAVIAGMKISNDNFLKLKSDVDFAKKSITWRG